MADLTPPRISTEDVGAHEMTESSDDHFSSASEGSNPQRLSLNTTTSGPGSPIPTTRVERVDDTPAHGEVPGTPAYKLRTQDAVPDEIEIVPDGIESRNRSRATSRVSNNSRPGTPGGTPIPKTIVERVDDKPAHGEIKGTEAYEMRRQDAEPDEVRKAPTEAGQSLNGRDRSDSQSGREATAGDEVEQDDEQERQAWFRQMWEGGKEQLPGEGVIETQPGSKDAAINDHEEDDFGDDFGDDFDEFAEGGGGDGGDDDFGDFDDGIQEQSDLQPEEPQPPPSQPPAPHFLSSLPPLDLFTATSKSSLQSAIDPYLDAIFPNFQESQQDAAPAPQPIDPTRTSPFLSDRSLSLWQQLVSPPPMQPVNWTRSRIRRLFLVSLGVPVDLDEILPPSKQKRLVLPNINLTSTSTSSPLDRLKDSSGGNASTTSLDSKTGERKASKKKAIAQPQRTGGPAPPPDFDANAAGLLCTTTPEAMKGWEDGELDGHLKRLEELCGRASKVLEYWLQRKDDALKEKEALEGVIENLVGFVKGRRGK